MCVRARARAEKKVYFGFLSQREGCLMHGGGVQGAVHGPQHPALSLPPHRCRLLQLLLVQTVEERARVRHSSIVWMQCEELGRGAGEEEGAVQLELQELQRCGGEDLG